MNIKIVVVIFLFLILLTGGIYYKQTHLSQAQISKKLKVEATFYPLAEFAKQVGGEFVEVTTLVPSGTEPHDFEPTTQDIARMHGSQVYIYNGAGFEGWLNKIVPDLQKSGVITVDSSQGITLLAADPAISEENSSTDPHIWLDPVLAQQQVKTIEHAFIQADPAHQAEYQRNAAVFIEKLQTLDTSYRTGLASCKQNQLVTAHAAFAYLAKQYHLQVLPVSGLSPDEEPSPQRLASIVQEVKRNHIRYIFFESLVQPTLANTIAAETGAQTLVFNPLEGLTPADISAGKEYISVQEENLQNVRTALQCQ